MGGWLIKANVVAIVSFRSLTRAVLFLHRDMNSLDESNAVHNNQLAFSLLEKELGIPPVMSAADLANSGQIDKLSMVLYLTQIKKAFTVPAIDGKFRFVFLQADR